ncbi:MAG TPA: methylamine utilization protein [Steroidobacteraceae bacterium]|nr:methylamine utilization protein [Candidatus Dormibacteraeota bacterium]HYM29216.1 methylamine utilization protein [Steroidobacteraceae bacterium]
MQARIRLAAGVLALLGAGALAVPAGAATLRINVRAADGRPLPGAVVTIRALDGAPRKVAPVHAIMDQLNRAFAPDLLVIPVGSTVEFPNSDSVSHQIYSFSPPKRFQLPLYRGTPYPPVHFDQAGVVTLGCNIHDEMLAYLVVTDAAYFGRTDHDGAFTVEVPHGRYHVGIWHPRLRDAETDLERELSVGDGDRADFTLRLAKSLEPAPLTERPHSWNY